MCLALVGNLSGVREGEKCIWKAFSKGKSCQILFACLKKNQDFCSFSVVAEHGYGNHVGKPVSSVSLAWQSSDLKN